MSNAYIQATFQTAGGPELDAALKDIGSFLGAKAVRTGMKAACKPILDEILNSAPVNTNVIDGVHLREHIKMKLSKRTKKMMLNGSDVFMACSIYTTGPANAYACAVEFGRDAYSAQRDYLFHIKTTPYTVNIAAVQPNPFMRTALYKHAQTAAQTLIDVSMNEIQKISQNRNKIAKQKINTMLRRSQRLAP
ncbi:hypothetical protein ACLHZ0_20545 [Aeromonas salmonicida]|uniref:hypothetical protein n=1 Tax=Aeromonas salmonicida TaxID=645 RepID=UPI003D016367